MSAWPMVAFGELLKSNKRPHEFGSTEDADLVGMRLYGLGPFHREHKEAIKIKKKSHFRIRTDDVIYNKLFAWKGTFGVVPKALDGMFVSDKFPTYEADSKRVHLGYLNWYFRYPPLWLQAQDWSKGAAALSKLTLNPSDFPKLTIPLPPLPEQRRLVERIDALAAKIEEARRLQSAVSGETAAVLGAYLNRLFGNPYKEELGSLGIKSFELLGKLVKDVADGPHVTPTYVEQGIPFVTAQNITSGRVSFANTKRITLDAHALYQKRARAEKGDVLITKDGTIGVPCFIDIEEEFSYFVSVALIKPKREVLDGEFLIWAIRAPYLQDRIRARSRGDMIRHLVLREIRDLTVPVPELNEQRRIVESLDRFRSHLDGLSQMRKAADAELAALLPAILDRAFKGEL